MSCVGCRALAVDNQCRVSLTFSVVGAQLWTPQCRFISKLSVLRQNLLYFLHGTLSTIRNNLQDDFTKLKSPEKVTKFKILKCPQCGNFHWLKMFLFTWHSVATTFILVANPSPASYWSTSVIRIVLNFLLYIKTIMWTVLLHVHAKR